MDQRSIGVLGQNMAYVEEGSGDPIVFLHGNPTSSFLWRSVIPHLVGLGRCLAPDLIGMGNSDKLPDSGPGSYRFVEHRRYLDAWFEALGTTENVTLVVHDWGSALGFDWAARHPGAVRAIAYMEAVVCPLTWEDWPEAPRGIFQAFRSPAGEEMVLERNLFVEAVLPASIQRRLSDDEMAEYRRPFARPGEDRRPTLTWPREIPVDGQPADVVEIVQSYSTWAQRRSGRLSVRKSRGWELVLGGVSGRVGCSERLRSSPVRSFGASRVAAALFWAVFAQRGPWPHRGLPASVVLRRAERREALGPSSHAATRSRLPLHRPAPVKQKYASARRRCRCGSGFARPAVTPLARARPELLISMSAVAVGGVFPKPWRRECVLMLIGRSAEHRDRTRAMANPAAAEL